MKTEDQVCSLQRAIKLNELTVFQDANYFWIHYSNSEKYHLNRKTTSEEFYNHSLAKYGEESTAEMVAAFSVAELGLLLPLNYRSVCTTPGNWKGYDAKSNECPIEDNCFSTEAECRAAMLIEVLTMTTDQTNI